MTSAHPHLDARAQRRRQSRRRALITLGVVLAVVLIVLVVLLVNAGRWGVPGFSFTNERGSRCHNHVVGVTCDPMTIEDVGFRAGIEIPPGATMQSATYSEAGRFDLTSQLTFPQPTAQQTADAFAAKFGDCRPGLATPLSAIEGIKDVCVRSNDFPGATLNGGKLSDRLWTVSTGNRPDGSVAVHLRVRSR